jgi:hypothetical protein
METFLPAWLDRFFRVHPRMMLLCLIVLALVVSLMVLSQTAQEIVAYEAF